MFLHTSEHIALMYEIRLISLSVVLSLKAITPPAAAPPIDSTYHQPASFLCL